MLQNSQQTITKERRGSRRRRRRRGHIPTGWCNIMRGGGEVVEKKKFTPRCENRNFSTASEVGKKAAEIIQE